MHSEKPAQTEPLDILLITVNEYYYIPTFLGEIVDAEEYRIVGLTTMPPSLGTQNLFVFAYDLFRRFGPRVFAQHVGFYTKHLLLDLVARTTGYRSAYSPKTLAKQQDIDHRHTADINTESYRAYAANLAPDVIVSVAATQQFGPELLAIPERCAINVHSSLLPEYRGVSPSFWTLLNDEDRTGITVHYMSEELDTGDVIRQEPVRIDYDDTLHSLNKRVAQQGADVLYAALHDIQIGAVSRTSIDPDDGEYYSLPEREDVREFLSSGKRFY